MEKFNEKNKIQEEKQEKFLEERKLSKEQIKEILKESPFYKKLEEEGDDAVEREVDRIMREIDKNK